MTLLLSLRSKNIRVWAEHGKLRYDAPVGALTSVLRDQLRAHKAEVLAFLERVDFAERSVVRIPMRDGVSLAADVFRPKIGGLVPAELPAIWCHERYRRSEVVDGAVITPLETQPWLAQVLRHGYVIVVVDARGTGASSGVRSGEFSPEETADAHDVTEWLAAQPWCDGNVGMYGDSYRGIAQLLAAATAPPHLKAIFPQMAMFDLYDFLYPGGVFRADFAHEWGELVRTLDREQGVAPAGDSAGVLAEHRGNRDVFAHADGLPLRDSVDESTGLRPYLEVSPSVMAERISASGVPVLLLSGWYDLWVRDAVTWFRNLTNPRRLVIGGWGHNGRADFDLAAEHLRWYDHWLKGVDTGVTDEPPIRYCTMSAEGVRWRSCDEWPPVGVVPAELHFRAGPTGSIDSVNDGLLSALPATDTGGDDYQVDYTATTGRTTRWSDGYGAGFHYEMTANDRKAITYTTPALPRDLEVTGHPVAHLWVSSTHPDGDFFVYLEEVDPQGTSHYLTEGVLRASHRAQGAALFDAGAVPYHPSTAATVAPLPPEPVELVIDLHPTSNVVLAGWRIRVSITCCDKDNARTPEHTPAPVVRIHREPLRASRIVLPVMRP